MFEASDVYICRPKSTIACPRCQTKIRSFQNEILRPGPRIRREGVSLDADLLRIDFGVFHASAACEACSEIVRVEVPLTDNTPGAPRLLGAGGGPREKGDLRSIGSPPSEGGQSERTRDASKVSEATQESAEASLKALRRALDEYEAQLAGFGSADADRCLLWIQTLLTDYLRFRW